jgi:RNA polymerase sigma-70 factor (ECF subfamily)
VKSARANFDVVAEIEPLMRFARALTRDAENAEDLVQEALLRAYDRRRLFNADMRLRPWLFSILHNVFISDTRRRAAEARRERASIDLNLRSTAPDQEYAADLQRVRSAFGALPLEQRSVLHLITIEGLSYREAADALDLPVGTIMSRLARGRSALRALVQRAEPAAKPQLHIVGGNDEP